MEDTEGKNSGYPSELTSTLLSATVQTFNAMVPEHVYDPFT